MSHYKYYTTIIFSKITRIVMRKNNKCPSLSRCNKKMIFLYSIDLLFQIYLKTKIFYLYNPNTMIPVFSERHIDFILYYLGIGCASNNLSTKEMNYYN